MKNKFIIILLIFAIKSLSAQSYYVITFDGTGAQPDNVQVRNLTRDTGVFMGGTDSLHLVLITSVNETPNQKSELSVYPNPMNNAGIIQFDNPQNGRVVIKLISITGRVIHNYIAVLSKGRHTFTISGVLAGTYLVYVETESVVYTGKIVALNRSQDDLSFTHLAEVSLTQTSNNHTPKQTKSSKTDTGSKAVIELIFAEGDQLRFVGYATGFSTDTIYDSPTGNLTYTFTFTIGSPVVTTDSVTSITDTSAIINYTVLSSGGANVTAKGVCWSTDPNPTTADSHTTEGAATGSFTSNISGLVPVTTYYVRAYATNSEGTGYGNQISFSTNPGEVYNPITGKTWMDRNLGAEQVATGKADSASYGYLFQWGRGIDGHQSRTSYSDTILSSSDTPGHGYFITVNIDPFDWRSPQNSNLWQGVNGINNPCPQGYRLPTSAEWNAERLSWSSNDANGAFASPLKLPAAGYRGSSCGSLYRVGLDGSYWSSTIDGNLSLRLFAGGNLANIYSHERAGGFSVRCIKD